MKNQIKKTLAVATVAALSFGVLTGCKPTESVANALGVETEETAGTEIAAETSETAETTESTGSYEPSGYNMSISDINVADYITVGDYKNLNVEIPEVEVDAAEVEYYYGQFYLEYAGQVSTEDLITDRAVENGDFINLDFAGYKDGVAFEGGTSEGYILEIGSGSFIDGFEDGLVGVMPGETVDLNLTFPENYGSEELAGADVVFTCTVNGIVPEEKAFEAFMEEAAAERPESLYTADAVGLSQYIYDLLLDYYAGNVDTEDLIVSALRDITTVNKEFPNELILTYQDMYGSNLDYYASAYGVSAEELAQSFFGTTAEEYIVNGSYDSLLIDAILQYIAEAEGMSYTDAQVDERLATMATDYGYASVEEMVGEEVDYATYRLYFMEEDVMNWLGETVGQ